MPPSRLPSIINNESGASARRDVYRRGGVVFVTSRILVMDLLTKRVDVHAISGVVLCNAHTLAETGTEAFILRICRRAASGGFVKAFTEDPGALSGGFGRLERTLRTLMVRKVFLWPRFHLAVRQQLKKTEPEVRASAPVLDSRNCMHISLGVCIVRFFCPPRPCRWWKSGRTCRPTCKSFSAASSRP